MIKTQKHPETRPGVLHVNMAQFKDKFRQYQDNTIVAENIQKNKGSFYTMDSRNYRFWLDYFNIFYTFTE